MGRVSEPRAFESEELLREALDEAAQADVGDLVEEPWGSAALAAAQQVADEQPSPELVELARAALERVAANSELRGVVEDEDAWLARIGGLRDRLGVA
jgi:hypothetical protein